MSFDIGERYSVSIRHIGNESSELLNVVVHRIEFCVTDRSGNLCRRQNFRDSRRSRCLTFPWSKVVACVYWEMSRFVRTFSTPHTLICQSNSSAVQHTYIGMNNVYCYCNCVVRSILRLIGEVGCQVLVCWNLSV